MLDGSASHIHGRNWGAAGSAGVYESELARTREGPLRLR